MPIVGSSSGLQGRGDGSEPGGGLVALASPCSRKHADLGHRAGPCERCLRARENDHEATGRDGDRILRARHAAVLHRSGAGSKPRRRDGPGGGIHVPCAQPYAPPGTRQSDSTHGRRAGLLHKTSVAERAGRPSHFVTIRSSTRRPRSSIPEAGNLTRPRSRARRNRPPRKSERYLSSPAWPWEAASPRGRGEPDPDPRDVIDWLLRRGR
jgi:hypothetical protein